MRLSVRTTELAEIAELNPALAEPLRDDDCVSFVPMSAVNAETATTDASATRCYVEVSKGYTPFLDGDLLVAKITPCFENGKIAQARLNHRVGFGSTEFHVIRPRPDRADARYLLRFLSTTVSLNIGRVMATREARQASRQRRRQQPVHRGDRLCDVTLRTHWESPAA